MSGVGCTSWFALYSGRFCRRLELGPHRGGRGRGGKRENRAWVGGSSLPPQLSTDPDPCPLVGSRMPGAPPVARHFAPGQPRPGRPCVPGCARGASALLPDPELCSFSVLGCTGPAPWPVPKVFASSVFAPGGGGGNTLAQAPKTPGLVISPAPHSKHEFLVTLLGLWSLECP